MKKSITISLLFLFVFISSSLAQQVEYTNFDGKSVKFEYTENHEWKDDWEGYRHVESEAQVFHELSKVDNKSTIDKFKKTFKGKGKYIASKDAFYKSFIDGKKCVTIVITKMAMESRMFRWVLKKILVNRINTFSTEEKEYATFCLREISQNLQKWVGWSKKGKIQTVVITKKNYKNYGYGSYWIGDRTGCAQFTGPHYATLSQINDTYKSLIRLAYYVKDSEKFIVDFINQDILPSIK